MKSAIPISAQVRKSEITSIENPACTLAPYILTSLTLFVFRVAAASSPQTARGETPRPLPQVYTGVWGRAPAETPHLLGAGLRRIGFFRRSASRGSIGWRSGAACLACC